MDQQTRDIFSTRIYRIEARNLGDSLLGFDYKTLSDLDFRLTQLLSRPFIMTATAEAAGVLLISQKKWDELRPLIERLPFMNRGARRIKERMLSRDRVCIPEDFIRIPCDFFDADDVTDRFDVIVFNKEKVQIWPSQTMGWR